ncbi:MAG: hypothetical protein K2M95_04155 [Clostridiales bacterium]|nr:hypothetical protein [Clostridiales bacterium]
MGKIVNFKPNIDYYYSRGLNRFDNENYVEAIKCYREAYRIAEGTDAEFLPILDEELACCYRALNLVPEAQLMYYKAITCTNDDVVFDGVMGLVELFGAAGNDDALRYYMDVAAKRGYNHEFDYIDAARAYTSRHEYRAEPLPDERMLELGKRLLDAGQYPFAREILEGVPKDSASRGEACAKLAVLYNVFGDYNRALDAADEAVEKNGYSIETAVSMLIAYYKGGYTKDYEECLADLYAQDVRNVNDLCQIVRAFGITENAEGVVKFGRKLFALSPMRTPSLCYALALSNSGQLREARKVLVDLQALYPYDAIVKAFAVLVSQATEKTDFSLSCDLPPAVAKELLQGLNDVLDDAGGDKVRLKKALRDPALYMSVLMIFQAGSENSKRIIAEAVADIPYFETYIRNCLMDPSYPDTDKRLLLPVALRRFKHRPVWLTCRDVCRDLYGRAPQNCKKRWGEAYYTAYSTVALFGCADFEDEFDAAFASLYGALQTENDLDVPALSALIAHRMRRIPALESDECCIELFGADSKKYFAYKEKSRKTKAGNRHV